MMILMVTLMIAITLILMLVITLILTLMIVITLMLWPMLTAMGHWDGNERLLGNFCVNCFNGFADSCGFCFCATAARCSVTNAL